MPTTKHPVDIIQIATALKMPFRLYEALSILLNENSAHYDDALKHINIIRAEIRDGYLALPTQDNSNKLLIKETKCLLMAHTQDQVNITKSDVKSNQLLSACLAMCSLVDLFSVEKQYIPAIYLIDNAIDHLQDAIFWQSLAAKKVGVQ